MQVLKYVKTPAKQLKPQIIAAKYYSQCERCGGMVSPGDKVVWKPTHKVVFHLGCPVP